MSRPFHCFVIDWRVVSYLQTATDDDEQRHITRKNDSDTAFGQTLELVCDPGRRQAMLDARQGVRDYYATADGIIRDHKALRQSVSGIHDALTSLVGGAKNASQSNQRIAAMDSFRHLPLAGPRPGAPAAGSGLADANAFPDTPPDADVNAGSTSPDFPRKSPTARSSRHLQGPAR